MTKWPGKTALRVSRNKKNFVLLLRRQSLQRHVTYGERGGVGPKHHSDKPVGQYELNLMETCGTRCVNATRTLEGKKKSNK